MNWSGALIYLISTITDLYVTAILLRLLLQWVRADFYNPLSQFLVKITNPVLVPARRIIPSIGKLDTASVVVMLLLELLQLVLISLISQTEFGFQFLLLFAIRNCWSHSYDVFCADYCQGHHQLDCESVPAPIDPPGLPANRTGIETV